MSEDARTAVVTGGPGHAAAHALTFVFTDLEGSTRLLERLGGRYAEVLGTHGDLVRGLAEVEGGRPVDTQGDAFFLVFPATAGAARFASALQRAMAAETWPEGVEVRVRIGLHRGVATLERTGYVGLDVHHAARVGAAAHGGQVLLSPAAAADLAEPPVPGLGCRSLGAFHLKDVPGSIELFQLLAEGLEDGFSAPRTLDERDEPPVPGDPPHPGMVAYEEADAGRFFGREALIATIVERIERERFLALVGASGSGKSSILRAGVVPVVRDAMPGSAIALLTPTERPEEALDAALARAGRSPDLVAVDQLEELFASGTDEAGQRRFIDRLLALLDGGARIVVAIRADRYDRVAPFDRLRALVAEHQEFVGPMRPEELRAAIEGPLAAGGWRLQPGLAELIRHDIGREPGALPLLSHALRETWLRRSGRTLTLRGYLESGGVQGAIARTADSTVDSLDPTSRAAARAIFLRLTDLGEESPDTRRRAALDELMEGGSDSSAARAVLDRLIAARLVVTDGSSAEVAHEALIREWPALREWVQQDREALRAHRALVAAARDWEAGGRDAGQLLRGVRLAQAAAWIGAQPDAGRALERAYVAASEAAANAEAAEREAVRRRELEAARQLAEVERRRAEEAAVAGARLRRRALVLTGALGLAAVLAIAAAAAGIVATDNAGQAQRNAAAAEAATAVAEREAAQADSGRLAAEADGVMARQDSGELPLQLALAGLHRAYTPEADLAMGRALQRRLPAKVIRFGSEPAPGAGAPLLPIDRLAAGPDSSRLLVGLADRTARLVDLRDGSVVASWGTPADGQAFETVVVSADGSRAAIQTGDAAFTLLRTDDWSEVGTVGEPGATVHVSEAQLTADGSRLYTCDEGGHVVELQTTGGAARVVADVPSESGTYDCALSPAGDVLAVAAGPEIALVRVADGAVLRTLRDAEVETIGVAWLPDGRTLLSIAFDEELRWWDATTGALVRTTRPHVGGMNSVAVSPEGSLLVTGGSDGTSRLSDARTGEPRGVLWDHGFITAAGFLPDGRIATGSTHGDLLVWDLDPGVPGTLPASGRVTGVAASADGRTLVVGAQDGTIGIFPGAAAAVPDRSLAGPPDARVRLTGDGATLLTFGGGEPATLWDVATGGRIDTLGGPATDWADLSADGSVALVPDEAGRAQVVATREGTGDPVVLGEIHPIHARLSPDGATAVTVHLDEDRARASVDRWDARTGTLLGSWELPTRYAVTSLAVAPDGSRAAVGAFDLAADRGSVRIIDLADGTTIAELTGHPEPVQAVAFSADGTLVFSGAEDHTARAWDAATGEQRRALPAVGDEAVSAVAAAGPGHLLMGDAGGSVRVVPVALESAMADACTRLFRDLEASERATYGVGEDEVACPAG